MNSHELASIRENILAVQNRVAGAAERAERDPGSIQVVAVSKTQPLSSIRDAIVAGVTHVGENRVQEATSKHNQLRDTVKWHLVGHLQTNKVKQALQIFDLIHSVDSVRLLAEINRRSARLCRQTKVLVEVNTSGEESKYGIKPDEALSFMERSSEHAHIRIEGLMTIGRFLPQAEAVRPSFAMLRQLQDKIREQHYPNVEMKYLSMGMTNDFEVAIEEGANIVRIGTAIFGKRR